MMGDVFFKACRYFEWRLNRTKSKYRCWKLKEYLKTSGAMLEGLDSYTIAPTAIIHASSKLKIGRGLSMGDHSEINSNDSFGIWIGNNLLLADHVYIRGGNHDWAYSEDPFQSRGHLAKRIDYDGDVWSIVIEDNVWCGHGATILSGAHIGKGAVIGAGAVVSGIVPPYSVVIGNPYQVVSNRRKHLNWDGRGDIGLFS
jgi:acetyltransferase-like isoleucine patch superfamily enzyme